MTTKTTAAKTRQPKKLALTSRAKMGAARKPKGLKAMIADLAETVAERVEPAIVTTGLDGDAGVPAAQIGEPVSPAKAKAKKAAPGKAEKVRKDRMAPAIKSLKVDLTGIKGVDPVVARTYAEALASGVGVTPRELERITGLATRQRCAVDRRLGKAGYRLKHRRNPERDRADRDTCHIYWIEA